MATTQSIHEAAHEQKEAVRVIDTDIHEGITSPHQLVPYLDPHYREYITRYGWPGLRSNPPFRAISPSGSVRTDWALPEGKYMGSDLDKMRYHLFDVDHTTIGILNGFFHVSSMEGWFEFATALASAYNDWQIKEWLEPEPRLRGSVHVVAHDVEGAVREIERVGDHPQIAQVFLPLVIDRQYGDPRYHPIFEAAARKGLPVTFHFGSHTKTVLGWPRYFIEWHTSVGHAGMAQLSSLIFNGVFEKYPELKVVILESGFTWIPSFQWRADLMFKQLRQEVPWVKRLPSEQVRQHVRVSTQPTEEVTAKQFVQLVEMMGSDRILLFASDYPHWDGESPMNSLPSGLPEDLRRRVLSGNADETFTRL